jgi:hypothetical protein
MNDNLKSPSRTNGFLDLPDLPARIEAAREFVYAAFDSEFIKIGKSARHPHERLADLQTANARQLLLMAWTIELTEKQAHRLLCRWKVRGEWFRATPELLDQLATWTYLDQAVFSQAMDAARPEAAEERMPR